MFETANNIANILNNMEPLRGEVIIDDRVLKKSIGQRVYFAKGLGIPYMVIVGKHVSLAHFYCPPFVNQPVLYSQSVVQYYQRR